MSDGFRTLRTQGLSGSDSYLRAMSELCQKCHPYRCPTEIKLRGYDRRGRESGHERKDVDRNVTSIRFVLAFSSSLLSPLLRSLLRHLSAL